MHTIRRGTLYAACMDNHLAEIDLSIGDVKAALTRYPKIVGYAIIQTITISSSFVLMPTSIQQAAVNIALHYKSAKNVMLYHQLVPAIHSNVAPSASFTHTAFAIIPYQ